jgi:hypothetical protein
MSNEVYYDKDKFVKAMINSGFQSICTNPNLSVNKFNDYLKDYEIGFDYTIAEITNYCNFIWFNNIISMHTGETENYYGLTSFITSLITAFEEVQSYDKMVKNNGSDFTTNYFMDAIDYLDKLKIHTYNPIKAFVLNHVKAEVYNHFFPVKEEMEK